VLKKQMESRELEQLEVDLLLEAIFRRYGYDFRRYARASITRRLRQLVERRGESSLSQLIPQVLQEPACFHEVLSVLSITVSTMFRDPLFYKRLREEVVPLLRTYPFIRVWVAGCACGEEAYSLAILLHEEGLAAQSTIYATDMNDQALALAKEGIYSLKQVKEYSENYQKSGPQDSLSTYFHADQNYIVMSQDLKKKITFAKHNLVSDTVFAEMHLILCRNVMIYFNQDLKNKVLGLLDSSLIRGGFLCLGSKESLNAPSSSNCYEAVDSKNRIYRKRVCGP
jgi:chemotaxis protein methyltransferase CheR